MAAFRARRIRRGPLPFRYVVLLSLVFFIFSTAAGLWIVNRGIKPTLVSFAESQTRKIAPMVINNAVKEVVPNVKDIDEVTKTVPNGAGGTTTDFNTVIISRIMSDIATLVQANLKEAENDNLHKLESQADIEIDMEKTKEDEGIVYSVPLGQATNNALLGNLGPRIPIRFTAIGDVQTNIEYDVEPYGINSAFYVVSIHIIVNVQIIIPFESTMTTVEQTIPIAIGNLEGTVPQFYNGNGNTGPSIQLPTKPE
ncbi:sporulation protein YunB [Lederbergia lenta]|uniref:Sporulation protein YunB n=1 Tax=Lederbergia lenta TaxID=1467 RepID=A0A2X4ZMJ3_LEDLE|nr:sporulation protein YunB [Lederbergia lenta]MEC2326655.1 sporulation protein YunB [Lederbergia lenta]SQI61614.1 sporulation protein YunB [Lederbergia lenta]